MSNRFGFTYPGWNIVREIGRGSFGAVYEIERKIGGTMEKAALKRMTIPHNESEITNLRQMGLDDVSVTNMFEAQKESVLKEYLLMRNIGGHTNVVNCDDVSEIMHDDRMGWDIYIRMELLKPMTDHIKAFPGEREAIQVGLDLCSALVLCEKHKIIHRDIKPQNIFISPNGDYKLGDFGIARTIESATHGASTMGIGTNNYMAPEVRYGQENYNHTVDIYSLGLVLYWLLNDMRLPFYPLPPTPLKLTDVQNAQHRRMRGDTIPAPKHGSDALKAVVLKACAYDPKDRYQSAADMKKALEAIVAAFKSKTQEAVSAPVVELDPTVRQPKAVVAEPAIADEDVTVSAYRPMAEMKLAEEPVVDQGDHTVVETETAKTVFTKQPEMEEEKPAATDQPIQSEPEKINEQPAPKKKSKLPLLLVCILLLAVGVGAFFFGGGSLNATPAEAFEYEVLDDGTVAITGLKDRSYETIVIPEKIVGKSVAKIGTHAFTGCISFEEIIIPDSVTIIGNYAFLNCRSLKRIVLPKALDTIGNEAFSSCYSLEEIIIPDSVKTICDGAFKQCSSLKEIIIPDSVTAIGGYAFYGCSSLTEIVIPESVTTIRYNAFEGCSSLTEIVIPKTVTTIEGRTFYGCRSLTEIVIPESVTTIGDRAFYGCSFLTEIVIPESVTSIGGYAFDNCSNLQAVYYEGSKNQWKKIDIDDSNSSLTYATVYYNYKG